MYDLIKKMDLTKFKITFNPTINNMTKKDLKIFNFQ
jgi:hypothetical protein